MRAVPWKRDREPRVELGPAILDLGEIGVEPVEVVEHLAHRRVLVAYPSGSFLIVPEGLLR